MTIHNLDKIFHPKHVAVIGASPKRGTVGNTVLQNLLQGEFIGAVYPVNPKYDQIEGLPAFANVAVLPTPVDLAIICTPARTVPQIVDECGRAGILGVVIVSAGFREIGGSGVELQQQLTGVVSSYAGMRVVGPNCLGVIAPHVSLNASFAADMPNTGRVAFISQSGALCTAVLDWALQENIGFSNVVSVGNTMDVGMGDLIDYFATDPHTDSIILYIESVENPSKFMAAARAFSRKKPIIAYKAGRFAESAQAAASHTGAMAGVDAVYEAAFRRAGIVRAAEMSDIFDCVRLLAHSKPAAGSRVAIVTNAGGPGVMATDELLSHHGTLAELSPATFTRLHSLLPANWSQANPVDVIGDATPERFSGALKAVLEDEQVDAAIALFTPQAMSHPTEAARALVEFEKNSSKPVLACWMGGKSMQQAADIFNQAGVPAYATPEQAVRALCYVDNALRNREKLSDAPRDIAVNLPMAWEQRREVFDTVVAAGNEILTESESKQLLDAYGIPVSHTLEASSLEQAVEAAHQIGYPVVMKILSPDITHKIDVGGVALDLTNDAEVSSTYERMLQSARDARPDARLEGVTLQRMYGHPAALELIVGAKRDATFGAVLLVGAGGTTAELFQDRVLELPPLSDHLARRMLESLNSWPLLNGYRGAPALAIDRLVEVLLRFSQLIVDFPEITELDINPLLVTPDEVVALDARVIVDRQLLSQSPERHSHLAIRPSPTPESQVAYAASK